MVGFLKVIFGGFWVSLGKFGLSNEVSNLHLIASCDDASTNCHFRVYQNELKYCIWYLKHQLSQIPFIAETSKPLCYLITQMGNYKVEITCSVSKTLKYTVVFSNLLNHMDKDFHSRDFNPRDFLS